MIKDITIKKLEKYKDDRGWLSEIYRDDETDYKSVMAYVSVTKPGVVRGPHEHEFQSDCFVFLGPGTFELYLWDRRENSETSGEQMKLIVGEDEPTVVIVPPGVVHGYKCVSEKSAWCINFPNKLYKGKGKKDKIDEIRWEEDASSPYVIK